MKSVSVKKWLPVLVAPALIIGYALGATSSANAQVQLDPKSPQEIMQMIADSHGGDYSGTLTTTVDVGLSQLGSVGDSDRYARYEDDSPESEESDTDKPDVEKLARMLSMISGTHEVRVFVDGPDKIRLQVMDGMDEQNFIRNGTTLWHYDSEADTFDKATMPEMPDMSDMRRNHSGEREDSAPMTPGGLANKFLSELDQSTTVSVNDEARIAGRDAYSLELAPRTSNSLVENVSIGVDAETGTPLSFTIDAVGQNNPAVSMEFTSFTPETPDAALFEFTPPEGATVREHDMSQWMEDHDFQPPYEDMDRDMERYMDRHMDWEMDRDMDKHMNGDTDQATNQDCTHGDGDSPRIEGSGWEAVMVLDADQVPEELKDSEMLNQLATPVDGGRLLHTSLMNILITDDGRMLIGPVTEARLQAVAAEQ